MDKEEIIKQIENHIKEILQGEGTGHDWHHVHRVRCHALELAKQEGDVDLFIVEAAALLHDIADHKLHDGDYEIGKQKAKEWLLKTGLEKGEIEHIADIVYKVSFSGNKGSMTTKEGMVVQDADRLDALGAIGIARCFAYGGKKGRPIYDPYDESNSIQHFYDKLLKLKNLMNTDAGKAVAEARHKFVKDYLDAFLSEWNAVK